MEAAVRVVAMIDLLVELMLSNSILMVSKDSMGFCSVMLNTDLLVFSPQPRILILDLLEGSARKVGWHGKNGGDERCGRAGALVSLPSR